MDGIPGLVFSISAAETVEMAMSFFIFLFDSGSLGFQVCFKRAIEQLFS